MNAPRLLDAFCCQGGASAGYAAAGFTVVGVDIAPQPHYPFPFHQRDAITFIRTHARHFDAIHTSPPCQAHTLAQRIMGNTHEDLIAPTRQALIESGKPWVIENVVGAPLVDPIELCGAMFGLRTYRHRLFESNIPLTAPAHPEHKARTTKMGRRPVVGENLHIVGNFSGADIAREVMGMPWATRDGLREAIPSVYAEFVGRQVLEHIGQVAA